MKRIMLKKLTQRLSYLSIAMILFSFTLLQNDEWKVPPSEKAKKNPTEVSKENEIIGKSLYAKHCKSCHGKNGEGDGPKSEELDTFPGDFTTKEFKAQTDGELFYKTTEGRDDMPSFSKKIPSDEDRWLIVCYIRTF